MTQFNETELTEAVVNSFDNTPNPRAKFLLQELVKSLHDYVSKTGLSFEEWEYAIDFLTRTGQKCTDTRQEFILLSDVFGVSMLVDAVNHRDRDGAKASGQWHLMTYEFHLKPGGGMAPKPLGVKAAEPA